MLFIAEQNSNIVLLAFDNCRLSDHYGRMLKYEHTKIFYRNRTNNFWLFPKCGG